MPRDERTRAILLANPDPFDVIAQLPNPVFPVRMTVELHRSREHDSDHAEYRRPHYPVTVQVPSAAYIPATTIYFDNPAERPRGDTKAWGVTDAMDGLQAAVDAVAEEYPVAPGPLKLLGLEVVEVPTPYVTTNRDTGDPHVKSGLYERNADLRLARFDRDGSLSATDVRSELDDALPGESRSPIQLTEVRHVVAKQSRQGQQTQGEAGVARYYTESEAEHVDDLSLTPAIYRLQHLSRAGDRSRPLSPALDELDRLLPVLSKQGGDLLEQVTFAGEKQERTVFHAEEVLR